MAKDKPKKKPCDCPSCRAQRFYYAQSVEARRERGKGVPLRLPAQNAPSTLRLQ